MNMSQKEVKDTKNAVTIRRSRTSSITIFVSFIFGFSLQLKTDCSYFCLVGHSLSVSLYVYLFNWV